MTNEPTNEASNPPSPATSCGSYPATVCSASEYRAAAKYLRELLVEIDVEESKQSSWWRFWWGVEAARKAFAVALRDAEEKASKLEQNTRLNE